jgi:hypothetical protein
VLEDVAFSADVQFVKGADGEGELVGQFVPETGQVRGLTRMAGGKVWGVRGDSHEVALNKGRQEIAAMIDHFVIRPREDTLEAAHRLYRLAVQVCGVIGVTVVHCAVGGCAVFFGVWLVWLLLLVDMLCVCVPYSSFPSRLLPPKTPTRAHTQTPPKNRKNKQTNKQTKLSAASPRAGASRTSPARACTRSAARRPSRSCCSTTPTACRSTCTL